MAQATTTKQPRRLDQSDILASLFASVILIAIPIVAGHYRHFEFWIAAALVSGLAYLASMIPDRLRFWRLPLLIAGYFLPAGVEQFLNSPEIGTAAIAFILAFYWLPVIRCKREPFSFYFW